MLAALADIDLLVPFAEDTPLGLTTELKPDLLVKGSDYLAEEVAGVAEPDALPARSPLSGSFVQFAHRSGSFGSFRRSGSFRNFSAPGFVRAKHVRASVMLGRPFRQIEG